VEKESTILATAFQLKSAVLERDMEILTPKIQSNKIDPGKLHSSPFQINSPVPIEPPETILPVGGLIDIEDEEVKIPVIELKMRGDLHTFNREEFIKKMANELKIDPKLIVIASITAGSVVVKFSIPGTRTEILLFVEKISDVSSPLAVELKTLSAEVQTLTVSQCTTDYPNVNFNEIITENLQQMNQHNDWVKGEKDFMNKQLKDALWNSATNLMPLKTYIVHEPNIFKNFLSKNSFSMDKVKLLFHATKIQNIDSIVGSGFKSKFIGALDAGWYGRGHYFSSYPEYCLGLQGGFAYSQANDSGLYALIGAHVNLGNINQIYQQCTGAPLPSDVDSHYVEVNSGGQPFTENVDTLKFDEYVIKPINNPDLPNDSILPRFIFILKEITKIIIWRDPNIGNDENSQVYQELEAKGNFSIYGTTTSDQALDLITRKKDKAKIYVITNGGNNGKEFVTAVRKLIDTPVCVFCNAVAHHKVWADTLSNVIVTGDNWKVSDFVTTNINS